MVFSSAVFIFLFLPIVLLAYNIVPKKHLGARNIVLLCASMIFYAWGEPKNIILMLASIAFNYAFGLMIHKYASVSQTKKRLWLIISVVFNLGLLFYFKYFNLFTAGKLWYVVLPIGISFFTFQIMSYVIDVYRGDVAVQKNILKLALYISLFPQLIAGPIVRYIDVEAQLSQRTTSLTKTAAGIRRFIVGFAKKILISNIAAALADEIFAMDIGVTVAVAWLGAICYAIQIYFDFSGYSDMAIGLGLMFGFDFLENFNYPYISTSVQEFWRRWHISLSSWFRDYLYIPLGGNRKGISRTYINLIIVFACTGFWHGANWTFIVWGLYHGLFLIIERAGFNKILKKLPKFIGLIYTLFVVLIGWVLFRADTIGGAITYIGNMFNFANFGLANASAMLDNLTSITIIIGIILSAPVVPFIANKINSIGKSVTENSDTPTLAEGRGAVITSIVSSAVCVILLVTSVIFLTGSDYNPFIYFRF